MKDYTEKRLKEFDRARSLSSNLYSTDKWVKSFLAESIQQAVAEERKRVVREARQTLKKEDSDIVERVLSSLDKPLTDKEKGQDE